MLFEQYLEGLSTGGWAGDREDVRRAFFGQFGTYLMAVGTAPRFLAEADEDESARLRNFVEKRFQTAYDDIPDLLAPVISHFPRYVEEASRLLG